ncbi:hypothetical protein [Chitinophaga solisilvae]|uniref:Uncharacterized protein n=1 Tax=Chitinophaga solisilvae TaxID=1233460 RepID=A0A433WIU2_9BACT|nr:hypothetical protein [Chitinophaga solisilvae]NSL88849.1 hypothetical protein [Chitinophaga solisilvae]
MKTSKKLIIGFSSVLVLLMLVTDIVLRVNYSKGITNVNFRINKSPAPVTKQLQPFKVLMLTNAQHNGLSKANYIYINPGKEYQILVDSTDAAQFRQTGDTLFITFPNNNAYTINCPSLEAVHNKDCKVFFSDLELNSLQVTSTDSTEISFNGNKLKTLTLTAGVHSDLHVNDDNTIDSMNIQLGRNSGLWFSATFNKGQINVDKLRQMELSGSAVEHIQTIK